VLRKTKSSERFVLLADRRDPSVLLAITWFAAALAVRPLLVRARASFETPWIIQVNYFA
jgi:hypothetical protein